MTLHDLLDNVLNALKVFAAFLSGRYDAMRTQQLEDSQNALEMRNRVDAAPDASGMSDLELNAYAEAKGRLRKRGLQDV